MAQNREFKIHKTPSKPPFLSINQDLVGEAAGRLKFCGLKLYLYLSSNKDGYEWSLNSTAYKDWLQTTVGDAAIRKMIREGVEDLLVNKYVRDLGNNKFEFSDRPFED